MIFVVGGGEGGFSTKNAIIHVNAPLGSTVAFSKGGVVAKSLGPTDAFSNVDGETADYYYPVKATNYGEWTVAGTLGDQSDSHTVTVDAAKQYDIEIIYFLYLYKYGVSNTDIIGRWDTNSYYCTVAFAKDRITFMQTDYGGCAALYTVNKISLAKRTKLCVDADPGTTSCTFGLTSSIGNWNPTYVTSSRYSTTGRQTKELDISSNNKSQYHIVLRYYHGSQVFQVWLE